MKEEQFMRIAIKDAKNNKLHYGAIVVKDGKIISKSGKIPMGDARYHAETKALLKATNKLDTKKLPAGCILYSTCEPCVMCFYMAWITGISKVIYGTTLKDSIDYGGDEINIGVKELNEKSGNKIELVSGFLRDECLELFK